MDVRQARPEDAESVAAFTADTWEEFERGDYIPDVFAEWVAADGPDQHTVVAEREAAPPRAERPASDGTVVGCCQVVRLSPHEAWMQGMRVHPDHRGAGVGRALDEACREWARDRGATLARNMVFSWNEQGLGSARALGYRPRAEFRWAHPDPHGDAEPGDGDAAAAGDAEAAADPETAVVTGDPGGVWGFWQRSDAREALGGLALDPEESWALSEWTSERARRADEEAAVLAVRREGTTGATWRTRVTEYDDERLAEYGGAAWETPADARALFRAVGRDAAAVDADRTRVLLPETPRHVSDAAAAGVALGDDPDFVFEADLTER